MFPYINIFGLALPVAPFTYLLGIWFGLNLVEKHAHRFKIDSNALYYLAFISLISGVVGARLSYIIRYPAAFITDPVSIISINFGLFDIWGGLAFGLIAAFIYGQRKHLTFWSTIDTFKPAFALLMLTILLANFASGFAFGSESSLPWAIDLWGANRHPVQIYEALGAGVILWVFWPSRLPKSSTPGIYFLQFLTVSVFARLFFEVFRGDSLISMYNLRWAQVIAWFILAFAFWAQYQLTRKKVIQG